MGGTGKSSGSSQGFIDRGFGTWEMDSPGNGGGGEILLNSNSSGRYGIPGTPVYEARAWNGNYQSIGNMTVHSTRAAAERYIKDLIADKNKA